MWQIITRSVIICNRQRIWHQFLPRLFIYLPIDMPVFPLTNEAVFYENAKLQEHPQEMRRSRRSLQGSAKSTGNMTTARRWSSSSVWCIEHRHRMEGLWTFLAATFHPWSIVFYYAFYFLHYYFFLLRPRVHFNSYWLNKFDFDFNLFYFNLFHL